MKEIFERNKLTIVSTIALIISLITIVALGINFTKQRNEVEAEIAYYKDVCDTVLISQDFSADKMMELLNNSEKFFVRNEYEILEYIPDMYKDTFYDIVKYSHACERGYGLQPGTITSYYYSTLELGDSIDDHIISTNDNETIENEQ